MRRLVYLCDWLPPDFGAVGQYSALFARERASAGWEVTLVGLSSREDSIHEEPVGPGLLRTVRLAAPVYDRANFRARALWTARINLRLLAHAWPHLCQADEILFTGSPPFLIHLLVPANVRLRKRLVYRITDFHPECLMAERVTESRRPPLPLRLFHRATVALRRRVDAFEVLGEDQRRRLVALGIPDSRIALKRDPSPVAIPPGTEPLPIPEDLAGHAVLLYSGNFGVAHDHETFVAAYHRHHREGTGRVRLWLNATGARADRVEAHLRAEGLPIYRTRPVPLPILPRLLLTPDAHLITLRDAFVGYVLPSKVHGSVLSGRDVLYVGSEESDVDLLCREGMPAGAYRRVAVGDVDGLARALEEIADRAGLRRAGELR